MRNFKIVLSCLAFVINGRRLPSSSRRDQSTDEQDKLASSGDFLQSFDNITPSPWRSLALLLVGLDSVGWVVPDLSPTIAKPQALVPNRQSLPGRHLRMMGENPKWLLEQVLQTKLRILGPDHPQFLSSMSDFALELRAKGDLEGAKDQLQKVVSTRSSLFGDQDPETVESKKELGSVLNALGDLYGSKELQRDVMLAKADALQRRLDSLNATADIVRSQHQDKVSEATKESLEAKHILAQTLQAIGDQESLQEAADLLKEACEGRIALLGPENIDTVASKNCLAQTLRSLGEDDVAEILEKQVSAASMLLSYKHTGTGGAGLDTLSKKLKSNAAEEETEEATSVAEPYGHGPVHLRQQTKDVDGKSKDIPSHLQLDLDYNDAELPYIYVEESKCISCTWCAYVAPNTFFMKEDNLARVYAQGREDPEVLEEAINLCPKDCIYFVDLEDLIILETERDSIKTHTMMLGTAKMSRRNRDFSNQGCVTLDPVYYERYERRVKKKTEEKEVAAREKKLNAFFELLSEKLDSQKKIML